MERNYRALAGKPFPKKCSCEILFKDRHTYLEKTELCSSNVEYEEIRGRVLEFRNYKRCKSTIMIEIVDLRDYTEEGLKKREKTIRELNC